VSRPAARVTARRAAWGVALLTVPGPVLRAIERTDHTRAQRVVARVLGIRNVLQAAVVASVGGRSIRRRGAAVDAIHVLTSLGMAAASHRWRRLALADAAIAAGLAAAGVRAAGQAEPAERVRALQQ
jgi:hypothetical protein